MIPRLFVRAPMPQRIIYVRKRNDTGGKGNVVATQALGIAASVVGLMVQQAGFIEVGRDKALSFPAS